MSRDVTRQSPLFLPRASPSSSSATSSSLSPFSQSLLSKTKLLLLLREMASLKFCFALSFSLFALHNWGIPVRALSVGIEAGSGLSLGKECSRKCESEFCKVPPFLRYGKYCGFLYSGCPGEKPCDGLDACCMKHDACIQAKNNDYLSTECSQDFLDCMARFKRSGGHTFKGNTCSVDDVTKLITTVIDAALLAGRYLHKP
ncbi:phospholipase A2-alpha [Diospyros lotus]|uniref:phospholipase A2-alpha n=1 Tax=Diospyros lotus TaxID=55363 RepID=UPI00225549FC|nr:phospholipase A2-alpha [Diospyros lotus]